MKLYAKQANLGMISAEITVDAGKITAKFDDGVVVTSKQNIRGVIANYNSRARKMARDCGDVYCPIKFGAFAYDDQLGKGY